MSHDDNGAPTPRRGPNGSSPHDSSFKASSRPRLRSSRPAAPSDRRQDQTPPANRPAPEGFENSTPRHASRQARASTGPRFTGLRAASGAAAAGAGAVAGAAAARRREQPRREQPRTFTPATEPAPDPTPEDAPLTRQEARAAEERSRRRRLRRQPVATTSGTNTATAETDDIPEATRHSRRNDVFPRIVGWTSLGTLIPGLGMIKSRNSRLGWFLTLGFLAGLAAIGIWVLYRGPVKAGARVVSSPTILNVIAILLIIGALIWAFVIIRSYVMLRSGTRLRRSQRALGSVLVMSLIVLTGVPLGVGAAYSRVQGETVRKVFGEGGGPVLDSAELWKDKPRINVFLIGRDNGDGREGTRPDTMLVASIDTRSGKTTLISVPRNLAFPQFPEGSKLAERFPQGFNAFGSEESLINAVWTWAESEPEAVGDPGDMELGMYATMQAVEGSLGLKMDNWASVDMQGFEDVVDAIGGVKIDVERPIPMGGGTNMNTGVKNRVFGWIDPGEQVLTGKKALWYVRSREGADNYDRMCRQQRMLKTTLDQVNPREIALAYPKLAGSAERNVATDIPQRELNAFVELAALMQGTEVKSAQINNDVTSTFNPDYEALRTWVDEQINPKAKSQQEEATGTDTAETEEPPPEETGAPAEGIEDTEGKCYPKDYEPGSGWPGYPGPEGDGEQN
ncbi:LCP family protein [Brevibacterium luteolum]|uniref:LCP family glycopolymer transferase n=1 Tax=Brevibacterium luteolum TaxID=199591 RepID=UPI002154F90A|nr:LCP family protein [Brevibacterium luteolum]MCT1920914.1 LCP family protein [Brevibacterium luteolum]